MAQPRPIASHPAFAPLVALWFAALFGLAVAVLPALPLARGLAGVGLGSLSTPEWGGRIIASVLAALVGASIGYLIGRRLARRATRDPRPIYAEAEREEARIAEPERTRRPLRVREELDEDLSQAIAPTLHAGTPFVADRQDLGDGHLGVDSDEGFMILAPQTPRAHRRHGDLDSLLAQFDEAMAAFRAEDAAGPGSPAPDQGAQDPVHAFVERQTATASSSTATHTRRAELDHQAELRAALDKLARARGELPSDVD